MGVEIHPLASVDPQARLGDGVRVGPFAVIGAGVEIGDGTEIGAAAQIQGPTRIGRENQIYPNAAIGFDPQDLKFQGEEVWLEIGDRNQFREFCTVHRGTAKGGGVTRVGNDSLFMAYTHIAHDCQVGSRIVFANNATLAGHVEVHDDATVSAFTSVHQFCRVGRHAYLGGYTVATMDALPFVKTVGQKPACYGLNSIGLKRKGMGPETLRRLEAAYRLLVRSRLPTSRAVEQIRAELAGDPDVDYLIAFVESSQRGVIKSPPRGGGRGGGEPE
ncbi:MAG TPA: acyl-ACP--UDP-N-acetylglucosamine O-acyltransferase [Thermoanaerobaculia bacterium]|jgi:UDP-N-acetylglucosamine acyltransferase|nr:acyl-ACP--UDP-N-acetylglucosamine O-acyltransferase [Thermoanaerobaculia bacterium]